MAPSASSELSELIALKALSPSEVHNRFYTNLRQVEERYLDLFIVNQRAHIEGAPIALDPATGQPITTTDEALKAAAEEVKKLQKLTAEAEKAAKDAEPKDAA